MSYPSECLVILTMVYDNSSKIVDFLLLVKFLDCPIFYESVSIKLLKHRSKRNYKSLKISQKFLHQSFQANIRLTEPWKITKDIWQVFWLSEVRLKSQTAELRQTIALHFELWTEFSYIVQGCLEGPGNVFFQIRKLPPRNFQPGRLGKQYFILKGGKTTICN